jgi:uncharacterized integral membrane protein
VPGAENMLKRLVGWLVLLPLALLLVLFALANRGPVAVGFDPLSPANPLVAPLQLPLFVLIYACLLAGIVLGGVAAWAAHGPDRRERRRLRRDLKAAEASLAARAASRPAPLPLANDPEFDAYEREG